MRAAAVVLAGLLALAPLTVSAQTIAEEQALDPDCLASQPSPSAGGPTPEQIEEAQVLASHTLQAVQQTSFDVAQYNGSPAGMAAVRGGGRSGRGSGRLRGAVRGGGAGAVRAAAPAQLLLEQGDRAWPGAPRADGLLRHRRAARVGRRRGRAVADLAGVQRGRLAVRAAAGSGSVAVPLSRRDPGTTLRAFEAQDRARALGLSLRFLRLQPQAGEWELIEADHTPALRSPWLSEVEQELARREQEQRA